MLSKLHCYMWLKRNFTLSIKPYKSMNFIKSVINYKCPRCRQGDLYVKPFDIKKPLAMHDNCSVCNQKYEPEPGYYFGAMFISYIGTGFLFLGIIGFCMMVLDWNVNQSFILLIAIAAVLYLWIARISRSIYIHLDVRYKPNIANSQSEESV